MDELGLVLVLSGLFAVFVAATVLVWVTGRPDRKRAGRIGKRREYPRQTMVDVSPFTRRR